MISLHACNSSQSAAQLPQLEAFGSPVAVSQVLKSSLNKRIRVCSLLYSFAQVSVPLTTTSCHNHARGGAASRADQSSYEQQFIGPSSQSCPTCNLEPSEGRRQCQQRWCVLTYVYTHISSAKPAVSILPAPLNSGTCQFCGGLTVSSAPCRRLSPEFEQ